MGKFHAALFQLVQQGIVEMQRGGRRGNRAGDARENGLVIGLVLRIRRSLRGDIGRQRHLAGFFERGVEIVTGKVEPHDALPVFDPDQLGRKGVGEMDHLAGPDLFQRLDQPGPASIGARFKQRQFDPRRGVALCAAATPLTRQPRGDHLRVVQHQPVARTQPVRQVVDMGVVDCSAIRYEHARRTARHGRTQGDTVIGQVEIEIRKLHDAAL